MKRTILLSLLLLIPTCLCAQRPNCLHRTIPVSVVDEKELAVSGLTAENFRGEFQGEPVRIVSSKWDTGPRRIVILLDISGSMASKTLIRLAEILVVDALQTSPDGTELALIVFGNEVSVQSGLSRDKEVLLKRAREINAQDPYASRQDTKLWDAVAEAVKLFNPPQFGDAVYAITDAGENKSRAKFSAVEKALMGSGLRFYASSLLQDPSVLPRDRPFVNTPELALLLDLAARTGGSVMELQQYDLFGRALQFDMSPEGQRKLLEVNRPIFTQLHNFYSLELVLNKAVDKARSWKLELIPDGGQQIKGLSLHYPSKLLPCSATTTMKDGQP